MVFIGVLLGVAVVAVAVVIAAVAPPYLATIVVAAVAHCSFQLNLRSKTTFAVVRIRVEVMNTNEFEMHVALFIDLAFPSFMSSFQPCQFMFSRLILCLLFDDAG